MANKQDALWLLKNNRKTTRFNDLNQILKNHGWQLRNSSGSHYVYTKPGRLPTMIVKPHGKHKYCHPMDVNKVISALEDARD